MKKFASWVIMCSFLLMTFAGCAYNEAYGTYAKSQSDIAAAAGPTVTFHPNGQLASVGNPMIAMMGMQMKPPKDAWESFFDFLKFATPFAAIWGVAGALSSGSHGATTNVSGQGNYVGSSTGNAGLMGSPTTTTTTTTTMEGLPVE